VVGVHRFACEFGLMFDDDWTPAHLTGGPTNLYKEIALALKGAEWRQPGFVAFASKLATSVREHQPIDFEVPASYVPKRGPNKWEKPDLAKEIESIIRQFDANSDYIFSAVELHNLLKTLDQNVTKEQSKRMYEKIQQTQQAYDADADAQVSVHEVAMFLAEQRSDISDAILKADFSKVSKERMKGSGKVPPIAPERRPSGDTRDERAMYIPSSSRDAPPSSRIEQRLRFSARGPSSERLPVSAPTSPEPEPRQVVAERQVEVKMIPTSEAESDANSASAFLTHRVQPLIAEEEIGYNSRGSLLLEPDAVFLLPHQDLPSPHQGLPSPKLVPPPASPKQASAPSSAVTSPRLSLSEPMTEPYEPVVCLYDRLKSVVPSAEEVSQSAEQERLAA